MTLSDVGRLVAIDGELAARDIATLLDLSAAPARLAIEPNAGLVAADPAEFGGLYDWMRQLRDAFTVHDNTKCTKTSTLLHLKWPHAFSIARWMGSPVVLGRHRR